MDTQRRPRASRVGKFTSSDVTFSPPDEVTFVLPVPSSTTTAIEPREARSAAIESNPAG
jgi:hypothetical protein